MTHIVILDFCIFMKYLDANIYNLTYSFFMMDTCHALHRMEILDWV